MSTAPASPAAPASPFHLVGAPTWELSIFLLKPTMTVLADAESALVKRKGKPKPALQEVVGVGSLAAKPVESKKPWWVGELEGTFANVQGLKQKSPGAVLFVEGGGRLFALTFGYGRALLSPSAIVHDFGMKVVLNTASEDSIRSVDTRTIEQEPQHARRQVPKGKRMSSLGLDHLRDVLKGVTGRHGVDGALITGGDILHRRVRADLNQLGAVCAQLLLDYQQVRYRKTYGWVEDVRLVRDDQTRLDLEKLLWKACQGAAVDEVGFALPEIVDGDRLGDLRGKWSGSVDEELDDDGVQARLSARAKKGSDAEEFVRMTRNDRVVVGISQAGEPAIGWSLYRCLTWSRQVKGKTYVLSGGDWYALKSSFVTSVQTEFDNLVKKGSAFSYALPAATDVIPRLPGQYFEAAYNAHAAATHGLVNLDTTSMTTGTGADKIEPCDLLDPTAGVFVHVKDGRRSSVMSHLFNQGTVSLETLLELEDAAKNVRTLAGITPGSGGALDGDIDPAALTVMYAVIDKLPKKGRAWRLPFFGMLAARHADAMIRQRRAEMRIVRIDDQRTK